MGALSMLSSSSSSFQCVKVYRQNENGKWMDQGTGHATVDYVEKSKDLHLIVIDEEDSDAILVHHISSEDIYRREEGTIISWKDAKLCTELALSFQEATGCSHMWDKICGVQSTLRFNNLGSHDVTHKAPKTTESEAAAEPFHAINDELKELPPVELSNLSMILKYMVECGNAYQVRLADLMIQDQNFFPNLLGLFKKCEDLQNMDGLHMIFRLVRGIISLNNPQIFDKIFEEQYILDTIGSLEYNPDVPIKHQYRACLKDHVVFNEALPIKAPRVLSKFHQTYRVSYIKDIILSGMIDDATVNGLDSFIHTNGSDVVQLLKDDTSFIQELFAMITSSISLESKIKLGCFLREFCSLSNSLQSAEKFMFLGVLVNEGIFGIIANVLQSEDKRLVHTGTDILFLYLDKDSDQLRSYVQQEQPSLFKLLVDSILNDCREEHPFHFLDAIKMLIDPKTISGPQGDNIVDIFYNHHLDQLIDVLASSCPLRNCLQANKPTSGSSTTDKFHHPIKPDILCKICELLGFCVLSYPDRIKCFLKNNAIEKVLFLTRRREKYLVAEAIRFMHAIISHMDEHLICHIVQNNLLNSIIDVFVENGLRENMLSSVVLNLLEFIGKKGPTFFISYIVDSFWDRLKKFEHMGPFQIIKLEFEQSLEKRKTTGIINAAETKTDSPFIKKEKKDHIKEDSPKSGSVVGYDEDEEACNSACRKMEEPSNKRKLKCVLPDTEQEEFESLAKRQKLEKESK